MHLKYSKKLFKLALVAMTFAVPLQPSKAKSVDSRFYQAAEAKLAAMKIEKSVVNATYLSGREKDAYINFELEDGGFMIYMIELGLFLEINDALPSPYRNNNDLSYYGIQTYGNTKNRQKDELYQLEETFIANIKRNYYHDEEERILEEIARRNDPKKQYVHTITPTTKLVPYSNYFSTLTYTIPEGPAGAYGFNSLAVLMGYLDYYYDTYIIPNIYSKAAVLDSMPCATDAFVDRLISDDGRDPTIIGADFSTSGKTIHDIAKKWIIEGNENTLYSNYYMRSSSLTWKSTIKNCIDDGKAPIIYFNGDPLNNGYNLAAVAYGYDGDQFLVNLAMQGSNVYYECARYYITSYSLTSYFELSYVGS